jgi:hypothetical protein
VINTIRTRHEASALAAESTPENESSLALEGSGADLGGVPPKPPQQQHVTSAGEGGRGPGRPRQAGRPGRRLPWTGQAVHREATGLD